MRSFTWLCCASAVLAAISSPGFAGDITTEWASVKPPPVPELKPVTVDPKTTALLLLDFMKDNCGQRPLCLATIPNVQKLLDTARAQNVPVFYTLVGRDPTPANMVDQSLAPRTNDFIVKGSAGAGDKFINSNLDQGLKEKGIRTVILTGTSAQVAVGGTALGAALRDYKAVVPVDGMSSENEYNEQYAAWHIYEGGPQVLRKNATLTRIDLIKFGS